MGSNQFLLKLENSLRMQLEEFGLAKDNKIEVKLIAAKVPEWSNDELDKKLRSMFGSMLIGDVKAYEDLRQVRANEKSYEFSWNESMLHNIERQVANLSIIHSEADDMKALISNFGNSLETLIKDPYDLVDELKIDESILQLFSDMEEDPSTYSETEEQLKQSDQSSEEAVDV